MTFPGHVLNSSSLIPIRYTGLIEITVIPLLAPAVTVGETEGAMDSTSVLFWPLLLPITL